MNKTIETYFTSDMYISQTQGFGLSKREPSQTATTQKVGDRCRRLEIVNRLICGRLGGCTFAETKPCARKCFEWHRQSSET